MDRYEMKKAAKTAMVEFKRSRGIKAVVPKTKNEKLESKLLKRKRDRREAERLINQTFGPASEVRKITSGDGKP